VSESTHNVDDRLDWDLTIRPESGWFDLRLGELWRYRDLIWLFVRRDFVVFYKQTILGPLWYLLQPLLTTIMMTIVFSRLANISTDGVPPFLFYLSGTIAWSYFAQSLTQTSNTFISNASVFGKVYFPRMVVPVATVIIGFAQFGIQLALFLLVYAYYLLTGLAIDPSIWILVLPVALLQMAMLGLGMGMLVSSLTTKYRDLVFLMTFGVQLWMYATPVVYPSSIVPESVRHLYMMNPMASIVELFRFAFLGQGTIAIEYFAYSWISTLCVLFLGVVVFQRVERSFMDTV